MLLAAAAMAAIATAYWGRPEVAGRIADSRSFRIAVLFQINSSPIGHDRFAFVGNLTDVPPPQKK
jgi:hypothetical protein